MVEMTKKIRNYLCHDWPLHFFLLITNWLPDNVFFLRLRGWIARPFFGSCGANLRLGRNLSFYNPTAIHLGRDIYIAYGCWFVGGAEICVGDEVMFGPYCVIASSNHTRINRSYRYGDPVKRPIQIGNGSWIASHVTVTAGSKIGSGSLVAANSVVTGKIPENVMVGGCPAHIIKEFSDA